MILLWPGCEDDARVDAGAGQVDAAGPSAVGSGSVTDSGSGASPGTDTVLGGASSGGDTASGGQPAPASSGGGPGAVAASGGQYPGIGSEAALAGPNCDRATGRIRFPSRYAPPCVTPWPAGADNGGATSTGVTADKIKVVVYQAPSAQRNEAQAQQQWRDTYATFNEHFDMWGRKVELVFFEGSAADEVAQRADAIKVATDIKPFAVTTGPTSAEIFSRELAARGVVMFDHNATWKSTQDQAGFRWAVQMDDRTTILHAAEWTGKRLAGRPAQWAGDATLNGKPRVFGLIYPDLWDKAAFDEVAARNGLKLADALSYKQGDVPGAQERARTVISRLKSKGVTSVILGSDYLFNVVLTKEATSQLYRPEWVLTGWNYQDVVLFARLNDQQQWAHAFGIGPVQVLPPPEVFETVAVHQWHHGRAPVSNGENGSSWVSAYTFFPCLQLAGPTLTPATFRNGCFSFPPSGGTYCDCPMYIGISYGKGAGVPWTDYTGWDDMTEKWWDPNASGQDEAAITPTGGYYQKVDMGRRFGPGKWPTGEPKMFDPANAVTFPPDYTDHDRPPSYEHRKH